MGINSSTSNSSNLNPHSSYRHSRSFDHSLHPHSHSHSPAAIVIDGIDSVFGGGFNHSSSEDVHSYHFAWHFQVAVSAVLAIT